MCEHGLDRPRRVRHWLGDIAAASRVARRGNKAQHDAARKAASNRSVATRDRRDEAAASCDTSNFTLTNASLAPMFREQWESLTAK